jgi:two-component system cell cycle response regulator
VFTEEADDRAKSLVIQLEVAHRRREAEALAEINRALQAANARLEALATTDPLTGLPNHRALAAALDAETARACRDGSRCGLLFLDIDHFKKFNDIHGHPVGDAVLVEFTACVRACLREDDILGRWGGEEFLALLPGADSDEMLWIGKRVRVAVADHRLAAKEGLSMTCSIGAAACPPQQATRHSLVEAAD